MQISLFSIFIRLMKKNSLIFTVNKRTLIKICNKRVGKNKLKTYRELWCFFLLIISLVSAFVKMMRLTSTMNYCFGKASHFGQENRQRVQRLFYGQNTV